MGTKLTYICPNLNNEQETIESILTTTKLSESSLEENLLKLIKCVKNIESKNISVDYSSYILQNLNNYKNLNKNFSISMFNDFLNTILINNQFFQAQQLYFNKLLEKNDLTQTCFRAIANFIIFYSKTSFKERVDILYHHVIGAYGTNEDALVTFLSDIISLNTDDCLSAFAPFFKKSELKNLYYIWSSERKERLLRRMLKNYKKSTNLGRTRSKTINSTHELQQISEEQKEIISKTRKSQIIDDINKVKEDIKLSDFNDNETKLYIFFSTSINDLFGEHIRLWLFEDYCQERNIEKSNCRYYINL